MNSDDPRQSMDRLVGELFDGANPATAAAKIERLLRRNPPLADRYLEAVELYALLEARHATTMTPPGDGQNGESAGVARTGASGDRVAESCGADIAELWGLFDEAAAEMRRSDAARSLSLASGKSLRRWVGMAAALAVCLFVAAWIAKPRLDGSMTVVEIDARRAIGVLTNATGAEWADDSIAFLPRQLIAGQQLKLSSGVAELTLTSGVVVVMRGPAEIDLVSPMRVRARRGAVRARVGEAARGFILETPTTEVIDLGTEFGVDVDDESGATDVVVFEGKVDLQYVDRTSPSPPARNRTTDPNRQEIRLLHSGEGLRVDADGATSRIVSIHSDSYPAMAAPGPLNARPALIRKVTDNLRDPHAAQYYQISRGGLREDARVYVDRFHEWNGVDAGGIPAYLVGADYVQTFNADKWEPDVEIQVELAGPARLFVLFDRRLQPPDWLTQRFIETGDSIGVDESFRTPGMAKGGIGPGVSIETVHNVWEMTVQEAGVVKLGALPTQELTVSMYGIAAIPWKPAVAGTTHGRRGLPPMLIPNEALLASRLGLNVRPPGGVLARSP